jgi:hypothetical protein
MFVYEMALTPEFKQVIANHQVMAEGVRRFGAGVEAWPDALARERAALIKGLNDQTGAAGEVVKNFRAAMAEAQPVAADVRRTSESAVLVAADLRGLIRDAKPLLEEVARLSGKPPAVTPPVVTPASGPVVATAIPAPPGAAPPGAAPPGGAPADSAPAGAVPAGAALAAASPVDVAPPQAAVHGSGPPVATPAATDPAAARPFDVKEYENLVREMNRLVNSTDSLLASRAWETRLNEVNSAAETRVAHASREGRELINYGFHRGVFFALFCAVLLFATALLYRFTVRRLFPQSHRPSA